MLVGLRQTVVCLEATSLRETCLARPVDDSGDPIESRAGREENLTQEGCAYDVQRRRLYLLCGYFDEAALHYG